MKKKYRGAGRAALCEMFRAAPHAGGGTASTTAASLMRVVRFWDAVSWPAMLVLDDMRCDDEDGIIHNTERLNETVAKAKEAIDRDRERA